MSYTVVDAVPGMMPEQLNQLTAEAEAGYDPSELVVVREGPGALLAALAPDVRATIMSRLDPASDIPMPEQLSNLLRTALAAA